ncbi:MAG: hypothetical protein RL387_1701 [Bacteroidota bacterium]|jgi:hypothetical protein
MNYAINMKIIQCILLLSFFALNVNAQSNPDSTTLEKVIVKKKLPSPVSIINDRYASRGMFKNTVNVKMLDFINNPPAATNLPILEYLRGKFAGVYIERGMNGNYVITSGRVKTFTDDAGVKIYLDEQQIDAEFLSDIFPKDVALVKYFQPGASMSTALAASSGTLAIYTRKGEDMFNFNYKNEMRAINKIVDSLKKNQ